MASKIVRNVEFLNTYPSPVLLNFTQSGTVGATGATGPVGATGATGTAGLTGPTGTYTNAQMYAFSFSAGTLGDFSRGNEWFPLRVAQTVVFGNLNGNSITYQNIITEDGGYTKFTFQSGTYYITIKGVTSENSGKIQYRLYDETNGLVLAYGLTSAGVTATSCDLFLSAVLTFTTTVNVRLEVGCQFNSQLGDVVSTSFIPEVYRIMNILKIA